MEGYISRLSEVLYVGLCGSIGTPTQIKIRRETMDTREILNNIKEVFREFKNMESGSYREGFRLETSDIDIMLWFSSDTVICDLPEIHRFDPTQTLILMECHDTPPGFANLQLLNPSRDPLISMSCVDVNNRVYISSSLYKKVTQSVLQFIPLAKSAALHGPCSSGEVFGKEYDFAFCFSCKQWPHYAYPFIDRCSRQSWPSARVLQNITSDGCHLVAIGSATSQQCENEWRLSFSQAECKLVAAMNHTQFLCYGLLKIYLKEVLNVGKGNSLLCSYFMKTTLFWKIQEINNISYWCPQNILHCVWTCFKYLIRCVYRGNFPNFFIPENNMFMSKIHGAKQKHLFIQLMNFYNMGMSCLLMSPTLYKIITIGLFNPRFQVSTVENNMISEVDIDTEFLFEFLKMSRNNVDRSSSINDIDNLCQVFSQSSFSDFQRVILHFIRSRKLIAMVFMDILKEYNNQQTPLETLISATDCGFVSDRLYVAIYLYNKKRYTEALYHIEETKLKLNQPYILDMCSINVKKEKYMEAVGGQSLLDKVRKTVSVTIVLDEYCLIDEIRLELHVSQQSSFNVHVPPLVMAHMLSFMCHHHLDSPKCTQSLFDLHSLLYNDQREFFHGNNRCISWHLLGICKQIYGDIEGALSCYYESIKHPTDENIHAASYVRIENISKYLFNRINC